MTPFAFMRNTGTWSAWTSHGALFLIRGKFGFNYEVSQISCYLQD